MNAGIPAFLLIALALVRPLPYAWWQGSRLTRARGIGALATSSWLLLNLGAGVLVAPSDGVSNPAIVTAALGALAGIVAVAGLVRLGKSHLDGRR